MNQKILLIMVEPGCCAKKNNEAGNNIDKLIKP